MRSSAALFLFALLWCMARATITTEAIPNPAGPGASGGSLAVSPDGMVWLTWIEPVAGGHALRFANRGPAEQGWSEARTIAEGADWFVNWADFPALTAGEDGRATAVWFVNNPVPAAAGAHGGHGHGYHARISRTTDGGRTWSPPERLTRESESVEFVSLATLPDGRVLAAWLDGRGKHRPGDAQRLYARMLGDSAADTLVDPSVCDCCQTTLAAFPDGSVLVAYRGRTPDEIRDIRMARFDGKKWETPRPLGTDRWKISACPVNGPQLAHIGGQTGVVWFTAADGDPRVLASFSTDAGGSFVAPLRLDEIKPSGRVATALLRNGSLLATWVDADGAIRLRRVNPDFAAGDAFVISAAGNARARGFPRAVVARDYAGGKTAAEMLVVFTAETAPTLRTLRVRIPEGELLEDEKNCECAPPAEDLRGYPVRGVTEGAGARAGTVKLRLSALPGVVREGSHEIAVEPALAELAAQPDRAFIGRIERDRSGWRLIAYKPLTRP